MIQFNLANGEGRLIPSFPTPQTKQKTRDTERGRQAGASLPSPTTKKKERGGKGGGKEAVTTKKKQKKNNKKQKQKKNYKKLQKKLQKFVDAYNHDPD